MSKRNGPAAVGEIPGSGRSGRLGRWAAWSALVLVFAAHTFQAVRLFPTLRSIVDPDSPVLMVDHAIHEYHGSLGARFVREAGTSWGFDPSFMAGYPETPIWDSSSNPAILFDLIGGPGDYRGYKVGLFLASIGLLGAIALGARSTGLGIGEVALASALAWFYFWVGFPSTLWRTGLFAFVSASAGVGLLLGLCSRFDRSPSRWGWSALVLVGSALFFVHVTAPILAIGGLLAFLATVGRRHGWRWWLAIVGAGLLSAALNLPWLAPLWRFREIRTSSTLFMNPSSASYILDYFIQPSVEGRFSSIMLVFGIIGLIFWWIGGNRGAASAFGCSILALILLTGFGGLWGPTRNLEPLRFRVAFNFLLTVPAASGLVEGARRLARRAGGGARGWIAPALVGGAILGGWALVERTFFVASWGWLTYRRPLVVGFRPEMRALSGWLRANTDLSARILFEDQLRLFEFTDPESTHWTPLLPGLLGPEGRMFIGGLYQTAFIRHHQYASFGDFRLGDRPVDSWTPEELDKFFRAYNIGWAVCWSPLSRAYFDTLPGARKVATLPRYSSRGASVSGAEQVRAIERRVGAVAARRYLRERDATYAIYEIERPRSYFLRGKGRVVSVAPNRVELADVEPDGGAAVLSLHWLDSWRAEPTTPLRPEPMPPDPVAFVRIEADRPLPRVVLYNSYERP